MKYKKWVIGFIVFVIAVFGFICAVNYFVDPFDYFISGGGDYKKLEEKKVMLRDMDYTRYFKAEHVKNYGDQYDAYILGGSKAGTYLAEKMSELDGRRYFNMYSTVGNFYEYYQNTKYLIENTNVKKIVLNISGGEVRRAEAEHLGDVYSLPALVSGKSQALEKVNFFLKDVFVGLEDIYHGLTDKKETYYPEVGDGARNLERYYQASEKDPKAFIEKYVTNKLKPHLKRLFEEEVTYEYYDTNLANFKKLKALCDENNVELLVIMAPSFIGEMSEHDGEQYWQFMYDIFSLCDVWDFSGYNDVNLNPYNYYNEGHFLYETYELMVDTIKGTRTREGFGVFVTKENANEHIEKRKSDYYRLKKEYEKTGTIKLGGYEDDSRIRQE